MKYNLAELFATKTDKQLKTLIKNRIVKHEEAVLFLIEKDCYPFNESKRYKGQIRKAHSVEDDLREWLHDAIFYVSESFWDSIIGESGLCFEGNCYQDKMGAI